MYFFGSVALVINAKFAVCITSGSSYANCELAVKVGCIVVLRPW